MKKYSCHKHDLGGELDMLVGTFPTYARDNLDQGTEHHQIEHSDMKQIFCYSTTLCVESTYDLQNTSLTNTEIALSNM